MDVGQVPIQDRGQPNGQIHGGRLEQVGMMYAVITKETVHNATIYPFCSYHNIV